MAMNHNILVTGNGFDLYHGKKTGYRDFIERVEIAFGKTLEERSDLDVMFTELCDVNGFFRHFHFLMPEDLTWTFFESEMESIVRALEHFRDVVEKNQRDPEFDLISYNMIAGLFTYQDLQIFKNFARIFEQVVDDPSGGMFKLRQLFITQDRTLNRRAMIDEARRELDDFTAALDLYMANCVEGVSARIMGMADDPPDYIINFNYTDTAGFYGVPDEHIFYAKGKAGSNPANLVLGCPEVPMTFDDDWLYFENDFQKLMKFIGLPDRAQLYPVNEIGSPIPVTVRYFGYSFPMGDAEILRELWNAAQETIVCYTDREDYAHKMVNLMRIFGKREVNDAVYDGRLAFERIQ